MFIIEILFWFIVEVLFRCPIIPATVLLLFVMFLFATTYGPINNHGLRANQENEANQIGWQTQEKPAYIEIWKD